MYKVPKEIHINIIKMFAYYNNIKEEMKEEHKFMAERNEYLFELYVKENMIKIYGLLLERNDKTEQNISMF